MESTRPAYTEPRVERLRRLKATLANHATPPRTRTPKHGAKKAPKPRRAP